MEREFIRAYDEPEDEYVPVKFINLTPHEIVVRVRNMKKTFGPSGTIARVETSQERVGWIDGIELVETIYGEVTGVPEPQENTVYITSSLVASRLPERRDVVAPDTGPTAIRENGQIVAVTRFQKP